MTQAKRLAEAARIAAESHPGGWEKARGAFILAVRNDADLLWELFSPYQAAAIQAVLSRATAKAHAKPVAVSAHKRTAAPSRDRIQRAMAAVGAVAGKSLLDTFLVNGQPIGDLTSREASAWAGSRERDARFVRLLVANLPPDAPIRKYRTGEDARSLYDLASDEGPEFGVRFGAAA